MPGFLKRLRHECEDWLRYQPTVRRLLGTIDSCRDRLRSPRDTAGLVASIQRLCAAARMTADPRRLQERIHERLAQLDVSQIDWPEIVPSFADGKLPKAAILKPYLGPDEKGVLYVSFENQWVKLLGARERDELARRYDLVVSPSGNPHNLINFVFAHAWPEKFWTLISNPGDASVLPGVSTKMRVVPLYASSWVNPKDVPARLRTGRPVDLLMVANFAKFKRHHAFFRALRDMPRDLRILLIGQNQDGRTADTIRAEAAWYGAQDRFELRSNQTHAQVIEAFTQARASAVLSKREGSCVVVVESMFADTPVALLEGAEIGSRVFLNDATGRFLREGHLAQDLTAFVREADRYAPRAWALANIDCFHSTRILNDLFKSACGTWTRDLATLQWNPDPSLVDPADRVWEAEERRKIRERHGIEVGR